MTISGPRLWMLDYGKRMASVFDNAKGWSVVLSGLPNRIHLALVHPLCLALLSDRLATQDSTRTECHVCGGQPISARFVFCQRCGTTAYCSVEHRKQDWKTHKRNCQGFSDSSNGETDEKDTAKTEETLVEYIVRNLQENYYCVVDNFHARELGLAVLEEVKYLKKQGEFKDGELVSPGGNGKSTGKRIREDQITWASGKEPHCKAIAQHMTVMDALMARCNSLIEEHDIKNRTKVIILSVTVVIVLLLKKKWKETLRFPLNHTTFKTVSQGTNVPLMGQLYNILTTSFFWLEFIGDTYLKIVSYLWHLSWHSLVYL